MGKIDFGSAKEEARWIFLCVFGLISVGLTEGGLGDSHENGLNAEEELSLMKREREGEK
jgi:hypothetical protein